MTYQSKAVAESLPVNSRRDQLRDFARSSDQDISELAWADLFKEFGISKSAEDNCDEDFDS